MKPFTLAVLAFLAWGGLGHTAAAGVLVTPHFVVVIAEHCPEGDVACNDVTYTGVSRATGKALTLQGESLVHMCADQVTPCRHLGWTFQRGDTTYTVRENGELHVVRGNQHLVDQQGKWVP